MKTVDISYFDTDTLRGMIGKTFKKYRCDPFLFSPSVYGIIGFYIGTDIFSLTSFTRNVSRFYVDEDVAVFQIDKVTEA